MRIKWNSGSLLDMEAHMPSATQNDPKRAKRNHQRRRNILRPKVNLQLPHRSPNETLGFNQDDHPYRMCNETGIPEFLEFLELQMPGIPMVVIVMSRARSLCDPTQQDFINACTLPIYKCHTCFKF